MDRDTELRIKALEAKLARHASQHLIGGNDEIRPTKQFRIEGDLLRVNGIDYTWPGADGSAGNALTTNASGTLSWSSVSGLLAAGNWKALYTDSGGAAAGVALGAQYSVLVSGGTSAAPSFTLSPTNLTSLAIGTGTFSVGEKFSTLSTDTDIATFLTNQATYGEVHIGGAAADNDALVLGFSRASDYGYMQVWGDAAGSSLVLADGGSMAVGTVTPNNWAGVTSVAGKNLQVYAGSNNARMVINALAGESELHLISMDNAANDRVYRFRTSGTNLILDQPADDYATAVTALTIGTGGVTTGLLNNVFNVKHAAYGAVGDGVTDDTAAIRLACEACNAAGGGMVYFPPGTYIVNPAANSRVIGATTYYAGIWVYTNTTLEGAAPNVSIIKLCDSAQDQSQMIFNYTINSYSDKYITFRDIGLDGNNTNQGANVANHGIKIWRARDIVVERVVVSNMLGTAGSGAGEGMCFELGGCTDVTYTHCTANGFSSGQTQTGFNCDSSTNVKYTDCIAYSFRNDADGIGFSGNGNSQVTYTNCHGFLNCYAQFNIETTKNVRYLNCTAGGEAPTAGSASGYVPRGVDATFYMNDSSFGGATLTGTGISFTASTKRITVVDKVTNGLFTGSATGWTLGAAWAYGSDAVSKNADGTSTLSQNVSAVSGETYVVTYTVSGYSGAGGDSITMSIGGVSGTARTADGTYTETITATGTGDLIFTPTNTVRCTIDSVYVRMAHLRRFVIGTRLVITGSASNNGTFVITDTHIATGDTTNVDYITVAETVVDEAAGANVTLNTIGNVNGIILNDAQGVIIDGCLISRNAKAVWIAGGSDNILIANSDVRNNTAIITQTTTPTTLIVRDCNGISNSSTTINGTLTAGSDGYGQADFGYDDGTNVWVRTLDNNRNLKLQAHGTGVIVLNDTTRVDTLDEITGGHGIDVDGLNIKDGMLTRAAYGGAYRTSTYNFAATNTWYALDLDAGNFPLYNVTHSTVTNPSRVTVGLAGDYEINYSVTWRRAGAAHHTFQRLYLNNTSEIAGSFAEGATNTADSNETHTYTRTVVVTLAANDYIEIHVGCNYAATTIDRFDDGSCPDPTSGTLAALTIKLLR